MDCSIISLGGESCPVVLITIRSLGLSPLENEFRLDGERPSPYLRSQRGMQAKIDAFRVILYL